MPQRALALLDVRAQSGEMADLIQSREHNAGKADTPHSLEATRLAAQQRANAEPRGAVRIYQHVGGRHPKKGLIPATGEYMWRDVADDDDKDYAPPKLVWAVVETVLPETVQ